MEPKIKVGILFANEVSVFFNSPYLHQSAGKDYFGRVKIYNENDSTFLVDENGKKAIDLPAYFQPIEPEGSTFDLENVTIGITFHWERKETQKFAGSLAIIKEKNHLTAINVVPLEDYLASVISSEMSPDSSEELLKAHAVVSRGWLLAQINRRQAVKASSKKEFAIDNYQRVVWYNREDHNNFDVCADDHCQRYQGLTTVTRCQVKDSIEQTRGMVLTYNGKICDARYSKCCGGVTELFENAWETASHPYLTRVADLDKMTIENSLDLSQETNAKRWITSVPDAFCNTTDVKILGQVLKGYDQETSDFFRWEVTLQQDEIQQFLKSKVNVDVGNITELVAIERGTSGRIVRLKIVGTHGTFLIGKELEIRRAFSKSHLYSSAFVVEYGAQENGIPISFTLKGAGWGHGVGLCQLGAAVMGEKGYKHEEILDHYFGGAILEKIY